MTSGPEHPLSVLEPGESPADPPAASTPAFQADRVETRGERLRRRAHQGRLQGYATVIVGLIAVLIALAATNTGRVHVDWLVGTSRVSLVWLVLVAAVIGWILGVLSNVRFQWLTRARPHPVQPKNTSSSQRWRFR